MRKDFDATDAKKKHAIMYRDRTQFVPKPTSIARAMQDAEDVYTPKYVIGQAQAKDNFINNWASGNRRVDERKRGFIYPSFRPYAPTNTNKNLHVEEITMTNPSNTIYSIEAPNRMAQYNVMSNK